jgi:hypothetical protein
VDILDEQQQTFYHMFIIANCLGIDNFRFYYCGEKFVAHPITKLYLYISGLISSSFQNR